MQTYLYKTDGANNGNTYQVGQSNEIDGLGCYLPLSPWDGQSPLVVLVGDWDCEHCGLNWQWARVVFDVTAGNPHPIGTIREIVGMQPLCRDDFRGIHFVEPDFAELICFGEEPRSGWQEFKQRWDAMTLSERIAGVTAGFRSWSASVAGISSEDLYALRDRRPPAPPSEEARSDGDPPHESGQ